MKQRLLLVLLALFTSIGWMNAGVKLTVASGTTGTLTFSKASGKDKLNIVISGNGVEQANVTSTSYKLTGKETSIQIDGSLASLTVDADIQSAEISTASDLKSLTFKKKVGSIDFKDNNTKLTSLTADGCGLTSLPQGLENALADIATVNLKNNKLTSATTGLKLNSKVTYYFDGNQIVNWPRSTDKAVFNYGTQTTNIQLTATQANQWFDIWNGVDKQISSLTQENATYAWRKGTSGSFSTSLIKQSETYPSNFQFFSSNAYQSGTYQCQISPKSGVTGPTYIVTVDVKPAIFNLKIAANPMEGAKSFKIANGSTVGSLTNNPLSVEKGKQLTFSAQAKDGYTFSDFEVKGLNKVSTNVYEVVGLGFDVKELTATAVFKKNTYKITVDASSEHGSYVITNKTDNSEVTNGKTVSYNDQLIIKATPEKGYTPRVIVNGSEINDLTNPNPNPTIDPTTGTYTFTTGNIQKASTIQILFDKTETYKLKVQHVEGFTLKVNGISHTEAGTGDYSTYYKDAETLRFPAGTLINLEMSPNSGETTKIKKILLNGALVASAAKGQFEMPTGSSSKEDPKSAFVTFETSELAEITVTAKDSKDINTNLQGQIYTYDGNAHAFQYDVTPTGLTGFTVKYTNATIDVENYQTTQPTTVGTYKVLVTRSADSNYAAYNSNTNTDLTKKFAIKIDKATPTITTAPTVTVTTDGDYSISGGVAQVGGKTVAGEWTVVNKDSKAITKPETSNAEKSHIATVAFIPSDQNNIFGTKNADSKAVTDAATVEVPVKVGDTALETYTVKATNIPSDMSLTFWNGDLEVKSGTKVAKGTKLTIKLTYPAGYTNVYIKENKETNRSSEEGKNGVIEWQYETTYNSGKGLEAALDVTVTFQGNASTYTPVIELATTTKAINDFYSGDVKLDYLFDSEDFSFKTNSYNNSDEETLQENMTITYKDASGKAVVAPINAGEYTVVVSIPDLKTANGTYKAVTQEFKALYVIEKAEVEVSAWPSGAVVGVGKDAKTAQFIGGAADVEGTFHFIEEDKIGIPETGDEYLVKFVPKDSNNYKEVLTPVTPGDNKVKIVVTDQRTLFISDVANGSIKVTDQNGNELKDEQILDSKITSIKVTATPNNGYVLGTLTVNNSSLSNGGSYTLGSDNVVVSATFVKQYTITLGSAPKGVKIATKPSSNVVVAGGSYTFTLNHVSGDKPTVTGASNISVSTSGSTTTVKVTNIQANATLAIALANPTAIKITTKETLSKAGKPMGTIRVSGVNSSNECYYGDKITVTATANPGVEFSGWEGMTSTENPYEFEATNATYTFQAKYHGVLTGIESVDELNYYGGDGYIFVNCPAQGTLTIISMNGRAQKMSVSGQTRVTVPAGVYGIVLTSGSEVVRDKVVVR